MQLPCGGPVLNKEVSRDQVRDQYILSGQCLLYWTFEMDVSKHLLWQYDENISVGNLSKYSR